MNSVSTNSAVSFIDENTGDIFYRGYSLKELLEKSEYLEVSFLLIFGKLPDEKEYQDFKKQINSVSLLHEEMKRFYEGFPSHAHPMSILSTITSAMSAFYLDSEQSFAANQINNIMIYRLLGKIPTIVSWSYKHKLGEPFTYPKFEYNYTQNIEHLLFSSPRESYQLNPLINQTLNKLLILTADFTRSCSTSSVRVVGSSRTNIYGAISSGMTALWGGKHMAQTKSIIDVLRAIERKQKTVGEVLNDISSNPHKYDFVHKVDLSESHKDFRRNELKKIYHDLARDFKENRLLVDVADEFQIAFEESMEMREASLMINIEGYFSLICSMIGLPKEMTPSILSIGKLSGWIAHWKELIDQDQPPFIQKINYIGESDKNYTSIEER